MSEFVKLTSADGAELSGYVARPAGTPVAAVVVVQEIFGVNAQIRAVADRFAKAGYLAIAPATFDRYEAGLELKDTGDDLKKAFEMYSKLSPDTALLDVAAAYKFAEGQGISAIAVMGFCYGGLLSWLSATRGAQVGMAPACTVGYYPGGIGTVATETPACPVMLHFGEDDSHIGKDQVEAVRSAHPDVSIFTYLNSDHAFAGTDRSAYNPEQAEVAWDRTLAFLGQNFA